MVNCRDPLRFFLSQSLKNFYTEYKTKEAKFNFSFFSVSWYFLRILFSVTDFSIRYHSVLEAQLCLTPCNPMDCSPPGFCIHGGLQAKALLQGILPTQESNLGLLHYRQILYYLKYQGSPRVLEMHNSVIWKRVYIHICITESICTTKLTQHCKSTIPQFKCVIVDFD